MLFNARKNFAMPLGLGQMLVMGTDDELGQRVHERYVWPTLIFYHVETPPTMTTGWELVWWRWFIMVRRIRKMESLK